MPAGIFRQAKRGRLICGGYNKARPAKTELLPFYEGRAFAFYLFFKRVSDVEILCRSITDKRKSLKYFTVAFNRFIPHFRRSYPQLSFTVKSAVYDHFLKCFRIFGCSYNLILVSLEMAVTPAAYRPAHFINSYIVR